MRQTGIQRVNRSFHFWACNAVFLWSFACATLLNTGPKSRPAEIVNTDRMEFLFDGFNKQYRLSPAHDNDSVVIFSFITIFFCEWYSLFNLLHECLSVWFPSPSSLKFFHLPLMTWVTTPSCSQRSGESEKRFRVVENRTFSYLLQIHNHMMTEFLVERLDG